MIGLSAYVYHRWDPEDWPALAMANSDPAAECEVYLGSSTDLDDDDGYSAPDAPRVWIVDLTLSGDYVGSSVERSNCRVLLEEFSDVPYVRECGGYPGVTAVALLAGWEWDPELVQRLEGLEQYCVADDDDMSALEMERENDAWNDYTRREFVGALQNRHLAGASRLAELDDSNDGPLWELFRDAMGASNTYPEHETGGSVYFDVRRIALAVNVGQVARAIAEVWS